MQGTLQLLVTLGADFHSVAQSPESPHLINEPPQDVIIFFGSYDKVNFTCVTNSSISVIWLNETTGEELLPEQPGDISMSNVPRYDGLMSYILTIVVRKQYNGTSVECLATNPETRTEERGKASLLIQGTLGPVGDLKVRNTSDAILLSWSPPFSLDVTGVDPDIWYTVLISNVTDESHPVDIPCTDCHNLTQTHYTLTIVNASPTHKFCFAVVPQNGAGEGEVSEAVTGVFLHDRYGTEDIQFDTTFEAVPSNTMITPMPTQGKRLATTTSLINTILIAAGCTLLIISVLLFCGCTALLYRMRRLKEKSMETSEVQNNSLYGIRHRITTSSNVAYELPQVAVAEV